MYNDASYIAAKKILETRVHLYENATEYAPIDISKMRHLKHENYNAFSREIESIGFAPIGDYENLTVSRSPTNVLLRTAIRFHVASTYDIVCEYYQYRRKPFALLKTILVCYLNLRFDSIRRHISNGFKTKESFGFNTEFSNGYHLMTSNAFAASYVSSPSNCERNFYPVGTGYLEMYENHCKRMQEILNSDSSLNIRKTQSFDNLLETFERIRLQKREHLKLIGYVTKEELVKMSNGKPELADIIYVEIQKLLVTEYKNA